MKRVLIIHGWGADAKSNWFPWLRQELESRGMKVYCPSLPNSGEPQLEKWLQEIRELVWKFDGDFSIIGHSLGAITALRILESLGKGEKIKNAILVSGFTTHLNVAELENFFQTPFDWETIRKNAKHIVIINSDNDPFFPLSEGEKLRDYTKADEFIVEHNAGHINLGSGHFQYPRVLKILTG